MSKQHELKIWPEYFAPVVSGEKTFEVRRDDRGFRVGDTLLLREWNPMASAYTGQVAAPKVITYILRGGENADVHCSVLKEGFAILGLQDAGRRDELAAMERVVEACRYNPPNTAKNAGYQIVASEIEVERNKRIRDALAALDAIKPVDVWEQNGKWYRSDSINHYKSKADAIKGGEDE